MSDIIITGYIITRKMNFTAGRQGLDKVTKPNPYKEKLFNLDSDTMSRCL